MVGSGVGVDVEVGTGVVEAVGSAVDVGVELSGCTAGKVHD